MGVAVVEAAAVDGGRQGLALKISVAELWGRQRDEEQVRGGSLGGCSCRMQPLRTSTARKCTYRCMPYRSRLLRDDCMFSEYRLFAQRAHEHLRSLAVVLKARGKHVPNLGVTDGQSMLLYVNSTSRHAPEVPCPPAQRLAPCPLSLAVGMLTAGFCTPRSGTIGMSVSDAVAIGTKVANQQSEGDVTQRVRQEAKLQILAAPSTCVHGSRALVLAGKCVESVS